MEILVKEVNLKDTKNDSSPGSDQNGEEINAKVPGGSRGAEDKFFSRDRAVTWVQKRMNKMISS